MNADGALDPHRNRAPRRLTGHAEVLGGPITACTHYEQRTDSWR